MKKRLRKKLYLKEFQVVLMVIKGLIIKDVQDDFIDDIYDHIDPFNISMCGCFDGDNKKENCTFGLFVDITNRFDDIKILFEYLQKDKRLIEYVIDFCDGVYENKSLTPQNKKLLKEYGF